MYPNFQEPWTEPCDLLILTVGVDLTVGDIPGGPCAPGDPVSPRKTVHVMY